MRNAAPRAAALAESLPEGSPARGEANLLLAELASLQAQLEQAAAATAEGAYEAYNIWDQESAWSESHELEAHDADLGGDTGQPSAPRTAPGWRPDGAGRWQKGKGRHDGAGAGTAAATAAAAPATSAERAAAGGGKGTLAQGAEGSATSAHSPLATTAVTATPPRAPSCNPAGSGPLAAAEGPPMQAAVGAGVRDQASGAAIGGRRGDGGEQQAKLRRAQEEADSAEAAAAVQNTRNALELQRQQAAGLAAGFGTPEGMQLAAQQYAQHVAKVVAAAIERGIQPITPEGEELIMLAPEDLREWERKHLGEQPYW